MLCTSPSTHAKMTSTHELLFHGDRVVQAADRCRVAAPIRAALSPNEEIWSRQTVGKLASAPGRSSREAGHTEGGHWGAGPHRSPVHS